MSQKTCFVTAATQLRFAEYWQDGLIELVVRGYEALNTAQKSKAVVQAIYFAWFVDSAGGQQRAAAAELVQALRIDFPVVEFHGQLGAAQALESAALAVRSGLYSEVVVLAADKCSDFDQAALNAFLQETLPLSETLSGLTDTAAAGLMAADYAQRFGISPSVFSQLAAQAHEQAAGNSLAAYPKAIAPEVIEASPLVASPLRRLHLASWLDGAAGIWLSARADRGGVPYLGSYTGFDTPLLAERTVLSELSAVSNASTALAVDFPDWQKKVTRLELWDHAISNLPLVVEALGLAGRGLGIERLLQKNNPAINAGGGLKAIGHAPAVTQMRQVVDLYHFLQGSGGCGLAQVQTGHGQSAVVHLLGGKR